MVIAVALLTLALGAGCAPRDGEDPESSRVKDEKGADVGIKTQKSSPSQQLPLPPEPLCYAFILQGDLFINCGEKREKITNFGDLKTYAVAPDGSAIALRGQLISLKEGFPSRPIREWSRLISTCGTIIGSPPVGLLGPSDLPVDILQRLTPRFGSTWDFRCSSDLKIVVGLERHPYPQKDNLIIHRMTAPKEKVVALPVDSSFYAVSPNGKYIVYYSQHSGVCVTEPKGTPECIASWGWDDQLSVSDLGYVLMAIQTEEPCYFKEGIYVSTYPKPGYRGGDLCPAVAYWAPGMAQPTLLEMLGRYPQWITPETAARLRTWSAHLKK